MPSVAPVTSTVLLDAIADEADASKMSQEDLAAIQCMGISHIDRAQTDPKRKKGKSPAHFCGPSVHHIDSQSMSLSPQPLTRPPPPDDGTSDARSPASISPPSSSCSSPSSSSHSSSMPRRDDPRPHPAAPPARRSRAARTSVIIFLFPFSLIFFIYRKHANDESSTAASTPSIHMLS